MQLSLLSNTITLASLASTCGQSAIHSYNHHNISYHNRLHHDTQHFPGSMEPPFITTDLIDRLGLFLSASISLPVRRPIQLCHSKPERVEIIGIL